MRSKRFSFNNFRDTLNRKMINGTLSSSKGFHQKNFDFEPLFTQSILRPKFYESLENTHDSIEKNKSRESSKERIDNSKLSIYSQFDFKAIKNEK